MGAVCAADDTSEEERRANRDIERRLGNVERNDKRENKLLLLGTGSSGKSTLFKGLRLVNGNEFDPKEQKDTRHFIRFNIVAAIMTLLQKSQMLFEKDPEKFAECQVTVTAPDVIKAVQVVLSFSEESFNDDDNISPTRLQALGASVATLWGLKALKATFEHRQSRFSFPDNMDYYFDKANEIMKPDYMPNDEDILKARIRTTGLFEMMYERDDNVFKICDVGGQRSERKKWIHSFEHVAAVIFVGALNHYACVLFEDETRNAMHEALELFDDICNSKWFRKSEMILFLNKDDLFKEDLSSGHSLSLCFSKEKEWEGEQWNPELDYVIKPNLIFTEDPDFLICYQAASSFILDQFLKISKDPEKTIYHHITCATDSNSVETVFWDVQNIVVRTNLKKGGLMM